MIAIRIIALVIIVFLLYKFTQHIKADAANTVAIIVTILGILVSGYDLINNIYKKVFETDKNEESDNTV